MEMKNRGCDSDRRLRGSLAHTLARGAHSPNPPTPRLVAAKCAGVLTRGAPHFNRQLKQDVHHLIWTKEPDFDPTGKGTLTTAKPWINKHAIHNPKRSNKRAPNLGLGLIDWESHCSALR
eukprot:scaffold12812_cov138-Isochrysis_galbana.AAC.3